MRIDHSVSIAFCRVESAKTRENERSPFAENAYTYTIEIGLLLLTYDDGNSISIKETIREATKSERRTRETAVGVNFKRTFFTGRFTRLNYVRVIAFHLHLIKNGKFLDLFPLFSFSGVNVS